jgi:hypothetical protein
MGNTSGRNEPKDKGVNYRVVRAQCSGTGETADVECRPVDLEYTTLPGAPPPLRPDPTAFIDDSGARGSAVECSLTVDFPNDSLVSARGHRDWADADVRGVMLALQHEESYSGVERFLFLGWVKFTATHMDGPEDRVLIVTSYGRVYAISIEGAGAFAVCGGGSCRPTPARGFFSVVDSVAPVDPPSHHGAMARRSRRGALAACRQHDQAAPRR